MICAAPGSQCTSQSSVTLKVWKGLGVNDINQFSSAFLLAKKRLTVCDTDKAPGNMKDELIFDLSLIYKRNIPV